MQAKTKKVSQFFIFIVESWNLKSIEHSHTHDNNINKGYRWISEYCLATYLIHLWYFLVLYSCHGTLIMFYVLPTVRPINCILRMIFVNLEIQISMDDEYQSP